MRPVPSVTAVLLGIASAESADQEANDKKIRVKKDPCGESQFRCDNLCHDLSKLCDGVRDCKNGADETNCENRQTSRYRRQDFDFGDYGDFSFDDLNFFTTSDYLDFNFRTTAAPSFDAFGTTAISFDGFGPVTTAMPDFGFGIQTTASFDLLDGVGTTAMPLDLLPPQTTAGFDLGLGTTAPPFNLLEGTTADFPDFNVPTTPGFDDLLGPVTTQAFPDVPTTAIPMAPTTQGLPLFDDQTTAPPALPIVPTTESLFDNVQTTAPPLLELATTEGFPELPDVVTTQGFPPDAPTTAGFPDFGVPTTEGFPDFGVPTTSPPLFPDFFQPTTAPNFFQLTTQGAQSFICQNGIQILDIKRCDGVDDCGDGSDESDCFEFVPVTTGLPPVVTTQGMPPMTTAGLVLETVKPTTVGFDFDAPTTGSPSFGQLTTEPQIATTQYVPPVQTTQPSFGAATTAPVGGFTTQGFVQPPSLPSMSPMGEYNDENFLRFQSIYENWRGNVFNSWLNTMSLYKRRLNKFSGRETQSFCTRESKTRSDCPNNDQECKSDLDGCLYCYCKINKEDDRAFIVEEYKRDIEFYETVLQKQWEEMWREWELRYTEWEAENQL